MGDELEEVIHHTLGNLSGEQIKADGGSSAPAVARAVRQYHKTVKEERKSYMHANAWWIITAVWAWAYLIAAAFDHTWLDSMRAGEWLALLDSFSIGAIGCVSTATLAVDYRTRQKAVNGNASQGDGG